MPANRSLPSKGWWFVGSGYLRDDDGEDNELTKLEIRPGRYVGAWLGEYGRG